MRATLTDASTMNAIRSATLLLLIGATTAHAQATAPAPARWELVGLPVVNFNSDEGFGYGALLEAYNYRADARPYRYSIQPQVLLTTRGRRDLILFVDAPALLAHGWRLGAFAGREQELATPYYGLGNDAVEDTMRSRDPNPYFYRYGRTRLRLLADLQHHLGASRVRFLVGGGYAHVTTDATPFDSGTTLLAQELAGRPAPSGTLSWVRAGLVWDTRDQEVGPRSGWWNELLVQRVDRALGATQDFTRVTGVARRYIPFTARLSSASRLIVQQSTGDVPLYDLATVQLSYRNEEGLGGSKMVRGVPKNRVMGKGFAALNNELRWRAADFRIMGKPSFLVLSGFVDAGRVWKESLRLNEMGKDLWAGYGGGVRLGFGTSSVIALDVGRSSSATQIYIGMGYAF